MRIEHGLWFCLGLGIGLTAAQAKPADGSVADVNIRLGNGLRITAVRMPATAAKASADQPARTASPLPYPRPPLSARSPYIVMTLSNQRSTQDLDFEHDLHYCCTQSLSSPPSATNYIVGVYDSGSVVDLVADPYTVQIGLTGSRLTSNVFPIGGVSGTINTLVSKPLGLFIGGLDAVQANGQLDLSRLVGHSNTSMLAAPTLSCGGGAEFTGVVGTGLISFLTAVIRQDVLQSVIVGGKHYISPKVELYQPGDMNIPTYPRAIAMSFGGMSPVATASYYPDLETLTNPIFPTMLSLIPLTFPTGGAFFANIGVLEGEPGPLNPLQTIRVLVDTGAQSCLISSGVAANLNLPLTPDFTVDICGAGGVTPDVPGYYVDLVQINALGGQLRFSQVPFIVYDTASPDGGPLDGILGTNMFWNRNIIFEPSLATTGLLSVSNPVPLPAGDMDRDGDVDMEDFGAFQACLSGPEIEQPDPLCILADMNMDMDVDQDDFGRLQACFSGPGLPADPNCAN